MNTLSLFILAVGLAMDAFAVAICKGLAIKKIRLRHSLIIGLWFGFFQGMMAYIGFRLGFGFHSKVEQLGSWIAFILLVIIGSSMIREAFVCEESCPNMSIDFRVMLPLAIATSIDALAGGVSLAMLPGADILTAAGLISGITFVLSAFGAKAGSLFGDTFKSKAELIGGIVLILLGIKTLAEHIFF